MPLTEIRECLLELFPGALKEMLQFIDNEDNFVCWAQDHLPIVWWQKPASFPGSLAIIVFSKALPSRALEKFLIDFLKLPLFPTGGIVLEFFRQVPICLKNVMANFLFLELRVRIEHEREFEKIESQLLLLSKQMTCDAPSSSIQTSWLDEEKTSFHEAALAVWQKWPQHFEEDFFKDSQEFLALSKKEFRGYRSVRHQLRLVCSHYLMRKNLLRQKQVFPHEVHLECRLLPTQLQFSFSQKSVLGLAIAATFPTAYQAFEERHVLLGVQKLLPSVQAVKESFLLFQKHGEPFRLLYLEVWKTNECPFSLSEIRLLKNHLSIELKKCVETLSPSVFGGENLEEILRNILVLSRELKSSSDIPQVMISFEETAIESLVFRVIMVRVNKDARSVAECLKNRKEDFEYISERTSTVGYIGNMPKEASVFCLKMRKNPSLIRSNFSLNFYLARQHVLSILVNSFGEIRDYNGGLFSKQEELFRGFKQQFQEIAKNDPELLENFFRSLAPIEMQALIPLVLLCTLFEMFLEVRTIQLPKKESYHLKCVEDNDHVFVVIRGRDFSIENHLSSELEKRHLFQDLKAWVHVQDALGLHFCYIYPVSNQKKKKHFCRLLQRSLNYWAHSLQNAQILRLNLQHLPLSLDPRLGGDEISGVTLKMLFDGLMNIDRNGKATFAVAKSVTISEENTRYLFKLRECVWNNGDRVTADDFCYAWKKILSPEFATSFSYLFSIIKNAKQVKKGRLPLEVLGIRALDRETLLVELEHPCSYFLELIAHPIYSPVNHKVDRFHPNWSLQSAQSYVCNGAFQLQQSSHQESYELIKNKNYWDEKHITLDRIQITKANAQRAFDMFKNDEIDWLGRPLRAWEPFFSQCATNSIEKVPVSATYWYVFNVQQFPFQSRKIRQALAYAINRQAIIDRLAYEGQPTFTPLPFGVSQCSNCFNDGDTVQAKALFEEGLADLGITRDQLCPITLIHTNNELRTQMALTIAEQWKQVLGVKIYTSSCDFKDLFKRMTKGEYQIGSMSWKSWINDPAFTLNAFEYGDEDINFSKWENADYQQLLQRAKYGVQLDEKEKALVEAERILINEMPVIPIFHEVEPFIRKSTVEGIHLSPTGNIDFRYAYIKSREFGLA